MLNVYIITKDDRLLFDAKINSDAEFKGIEKKAAEYEQPVCIKWERESDGQIAYYSPRGVCFKPYWYNSKIIPHKGGRNARLPDGRCTPDDLLKLKTILSNKKMSYADWVASKLKREKI